MPTMALSQHPDKHEVASFLREHVNWNHFFSLVHALGKNLNDRKGRFIKSDLFEMAIEAYGSAMIKWVDQEGWDHEIDGRIRVEMKHAETSLYTEGGKQRPHVGVIRMQNTLGKDEHRTLHKTFAFLLLTDVRCAAVVDFASVANAVETKGDVIQIGSKRLQMSEVAFVVLPSEIDVREVEMPSLRAAMHEHCRRYIACVGEEYPRAVLRNPRLPLFETPWE